MKEVHRSSCFAETPLGGKLRPLTLAAEAQKSLRITKRGGPSRATPKNCRWAENTSYCIVMVMVLLLTPPTTMVNCTGPAPRSSGTRTTFT